MSTSVQGTVTVTHCDNNGTWLVALQGEHDLATEPLLKQQTDSIWPHCNIAVIDLSEADFISSSVIRWLLGVERELEAHDAFTFSVVEGPPDSVAARTLGLFGARELLACYPTRRAALAQAPT